jgi:hypothetical protein
VTLRVLQTSCGVLGVTALLAIGQTPAVLATHDGAAPVASAIPDVPTEWSRGGPLSIPTIGVVPPGLDDWYEPGAVQPVRVPDNTRPAAAVAARPTSAPVQSTEEPIPAVSTGAPPVDTSAVTPSPTPATPSPTPTTPSLKQASAPPMPQTQTQTQTTAPTQTPPPTPTPPRTTPPPPQTTTPTPETTTPAPTTNPPPPVQTNGRGNAVRTFGENLSVTDGVTGAVAFSVTIESISPVRACTAPSSTPPANGHLIAVRVRVTTGSDLSAVGGLPAVRAPDFRFLGPDGVLTKTGTPSAHSCLPAAESFPTGPLATGQKLTGTVVLDVPATRGTIVFAPPFLTIGGEWAY